MTDAGWPAFPDLMNGAVADYESKHQDATPGEVIAFKQGLRVGQRLCLNLVYGNDLHIGAPYDKKDQVRLERMLRIAGAIPPESSRP